MRYHPGYRKAKSLLIFYLNTYIIPFGAMLIIGLIIYKHVPQDLKAQVFNDWPDGRIAFASNREGNWELYTINPDGTGLTRLTNTPDAQEYWPAWSPNGTFIAFVSLIDGNYDIEVMNPDGANRRKLASNSAMDIEPCFSPDGDAVAFTSYREGNAEIFVVGIKGGNPVNVSRSSYKDTSPIWNPGDNRIYFLRTDHDEKSGRVMSRVFAVDSEGAHVEKIFAAYPYFGNVPKWSKNGRMITFTGGAYPKQKDGVIYVMKRGRSKYRAVIGEGDSFRCSRPTWSPDGRRIAFTHTPVDNECMRDICIVNTDGTNVINLTCGIGDNDYADWYWGGE